MIKGIDATVTCAEVIPLLFPLQGTRVNPGDQSPSRNITSISRDSHNLDSYPGSSVGLYVRRHISMCYLFAN